MNKLIYILRHGETDYNRLGKVQGSGIDTDLNDLGRSQANAFYKHYNDIPFDIVITSALKRTWQTVEPFIESKLSWEQDSDINEISWGNQEGLSSTPESRILYRSVVESWSAGDYSASMEEGENAFEFGQRLERFVNKLRQRSESQILVCSHGRAMRALMCLLEGEPLSEMQKYQHNNTGLWTFQYQNDQFNSILQNDLRHLNSLVLETS